MLSTVIRSLRFQKLSGKYSAYWRCGWVELSIVIGPLSMTVLMSAFWLRFQMSSVCRNIWTTLWTQIEKSTKPTDSNWAIVETNGMCFGNRTQRTSNSPFSGEIRLSHSSPRKPYRDPILPMFSLCLGWCWCVGFFDSVNLSESQCFSVGLGRAVELEWGSSELLWIRMVG